MGLGEEKKGVAARGEIHARKVNSVQFSTRNLRQSYYGGRRKTGNFQQTNNTGKWKRKRGKKLPTKFMRKIIFLLLEYNIYKNIPSAMLFKNNPLGIF